MFGKHGLAVGLNLALESDLETCSFKPEVDAANSGKEGCNRVAVRLGFRPAEFEDL